MTQILTSPLSVVLTLCVVLFLFSMCGVGGEAANRQPAATATVAPVPPSEAPQAEAANQPSAVTATAAPVLPSETPQAEAAPVPPTFTPQSEITAAPLKDGGGNTGPVHDGSSNGSASSSAALPEFNPEADLSIITEGYAEIGIIVSGEELMSGAVIMDGEIYIAGGLSFLKDSDGNYNGFSEMGGKMNTAEGGPEFSVFYNELYDITITEGEYSFTDNGEEIPLAVPARRFMMGTEGTLVGRYGSLLYPIVPIAEYIGLEVTWDEDARIVYIDNK